MLRELCLICQVLFNSAATLIAKFPVSARGFFFLSRGPLFTPTPSCVALWLRSGPSHQRPVAQCEKPTVDSPETGEPWSISLYSPCFCRKLAWRKSTKTFWCGQGKHCRLQCEGPLPQRECVSERHGKQLVLVASCEQRPLTSIVNKILRCACSAKPEFMRVVSWGPVLTHVKTAAPFCSILKEHQNDSQSNQPFGGAPGLSASLPPRPSVSVEDCSTTGA